MASRMVILAFTATDGSKFYFAGPTVKAILKGTENGTGFGGPKFQKGYKRLSETEAREMGIGYLDLAKASIRAGRKTCFLLGQSRLRKRREK